MAPTPSFNDTNLVEPIAIVGLAMHFPSGANDLQSFWELIENARTVARELPPDRIDVNGMYWPEASVKGGYFLDGDIAAFDAPFFSVSAVEAASMDPQQRLLLETSYAAWENAGIPMRKVTGSKTSVYCGSFTDDYKTLYQKDLQDSAPYAATGITTTLNADRISWFYNIKGPSININTACSNSLVALDLACQGLRSGQVDMSLVGGVNLLLVPDLFQVLDGMNMLSPDGRCHSFDARANGYGRGEGAAMLVLKILSRAIEDGDTIRAVIRATACNQNGYTPGITQPSKDAQEALINDCYAQAGLDKACTLYVEAHGPGTPAGDPIEAQALGASFKSSRLPGERVYVGSVKTNIGHLEAASGIAGVIKSIAILENGLIPAITDLQVVNPMIDEEELALWFPRSAIPWPRGGLRRISVNSFGFGGSNAHVVLDDAYHFMKENELDGVAYQPRTETRGASSVTRGLVPTHVVSQSSATVIKTDFPFRLLSLSAADKAGTSRIITSMTEYFGTLDETTSTSFSNALAYTLAQRRSWLRWRATAVVPTNAPLLNLKALASPPVKSIEAPKVTFVFTGQGSQWAQMGIDLCAYAVFRYRLEESDAYLKSLGCGWRLLDELSRPAESSRIDEPEISQILCTAVQIALVDLLSSFNVRPSVVIGHSSGEVAAAYCCGSVSAHSAIKIAFLRGSLVSKLQGESVLSGAMLAVGLSSRDAEAYLSRFISTTYSVGIACHNSPRNVTVSGDEAAIDALKAELDASGIFARKLRTGVAYHSSHMYPLAERYAEAIGDIRPNTASEAGITMISTVSGKDVSPDSLRQGSYWASNLISPVHFLQGFQSILEMDRNQQEWAHIDSCLEIGPHSTLRGPIRDILQTADRTITYLSTIQKGTSGLQILLQSVGQLWCLGIPVDWMRVNHENQEHDMQVSLADLPPYAWDHSRSYLHESRLGKSHRLRDKPRSDLLGEAAADWNPLEARWRNFIRLPEHPWIEDHRINGTVILPAAAMLVMAIEAVKLLTDTQKTILGYELRDVAFKTALLVPDNERGVETHFFLRRQPDSTGRDGTWSDFRLCAFLNNEWTEVCNGSIRVDHAVLTSGQWTARAAKECIQETQAHYLRIESKSGSALDMDTFYSQLWQYGLDLCRTFRTIKSARCAGEECTAVVGIHQGSDYTVHPCTLDALLHMPMISYTRDSGRPKSTAITSKIDHVWIASSGLGWQATDLFHAVATLVTEDRRGCEARCQALSTDGTHMLADLEGMRFTVVSSRAEIVDRVEGERDLPWNLVWEPDITLMTPLEFDEYCANLGPRNEGSMGFYRDLEFLHYSYLKQILADVAAGKTAPQPCHLLKYLRWAKEQVKRMESGQTPHWEAAWESLSQDYKHRQAVEKRLEQANAQSICHVAVARHLQEILRGTMDPLELLFGSSILKDLYSEACNNQGFDRLNRFLRLYSHKHANIRYLEIGAGTGAATAQVLPSLVGGGKPEITGASYLDFTYTDISEQFFGPAKARFAQYPDLAFQRLDIEKPLASQGYSPESYDMIIAANVLHATKDLLVTLRAVNWLLRPGGKLVLFEIVNADLGRTGFIMGLLSGWWLSTENYRTRGPCLSTSAWNTLLKQAGFSGVEHEFQDHPNHRYHESSVLISTKNPSSTRPPPSLLSNAVNIATGTPILEAHYANSLQAQLSKEGVNSTLVPMDRIHGASLDVGALTIVTADLDLGRPFLHHLSSEDFSALQHLVRQSQNLVWLTPPVNDGSSAPEYNMITGLARVCPEEVEGQKFMRVGIETGVEPTPRQIKDFLKTIHQLLAGPPGVYEMEFEQRGGLFHIPRLRLDTVCQEALYQIQTSRAERDLAWRDAPPLKLITETPGILDSLTFVDDENFRMPLAQDEVEIQVYAVGLTFKDCLTALGRVPGETHGNECAGIVVRRGSACEKAYQIGDRVCMLTREALKTYARSKVQCVCPLPTNMSFVEGAAFPWNFVMAWTSLVDIGRLSKGERVLIHAAAGGTGQAAVQISQHLGAEIFVTVGSEVKKRLLMNEYHIPEDHIFYSRDTSFATGIRIATQGRGVDVVLNSLSGDGLMESVGCLGPYGRFVEIGKRDIQDNTRLPMRGFNKGISFSVFDGSLWVAERPHQVEHAMQTIMDLFQQGVFHLARPLRTFSVSNIHLAFTLMAQGQASGKTVIEIAPSAVVPAVITYRPNYVFPANATYVLAGGFGGIGRTIARWMVDRGARHLLIISRSGSKTPEAACLVDELRNAGVNVQAPPCDITDPGTLKRVLEEYRLTMPPIRGCVQASMVLQDALYSSMAHSQWTAAVNPKVDGSRNLDVLLPAGMDFFILLASTAGIVGQRGQSNYAAGNTYQDSLARHRITRGESAISIDLGLMVDDGYLTRNQMTLDRLLARGSLAPITRAKFLSLMEYYCDPAHSPTFTTCQMVFGLNSSEAIHSRGLDEPSWMQRPMFGFLHRIPATGRRADTTSQVGSGGHRSRDFRADLVRAQSLDDAALVVAEGLIAKLVNILSGLEEQDVDKSKSIVSYGLDSLVAVEIRGWFAKVFQADIPTFEILGGLSFERLGRLVAVRSQLNRDWVV